MDSYTYGLLELIVLMAIVYVVGLGVGYLWGHKSKDKEQNND